jgi:hypothetical protein
LQANGAPVSNLAGYKLYYGSQSGQYQTTVPVGLTTTYAVTNLSAGKTYYFAVKAYNSTGTESAYSNEVHVTLPPSPPGSGTIPQRQMRVVSVDSQELVERFVSPFQAKLLVAGKVEAHRAAVQIVWDAG